LPIIVSPQLAAGLKRKLAILESQLRRETDRPPKQKNRPTNQDPVKINSLKEKKKNLKETL
jgi:hypothetical protein